MFQQMKKRIKNEKGLTLVELLAVIVILGVVAAIAVPAIGGIIDNSRGKALVADATNVMNAANLYFIDNPATESAKTVNMQKLKEEKYLETVGKLTEATVTYVGGGANTIQAKGTNGGVSLDISSATLEQLGGKVTVSGGEVVIADVN